MNDNINHYQEGVLAEARAFKWFMDTLLSPLHASDAPTPEPVDPGRVPPPEPDPEPEVEEEPAAEPPLEGPAP